MSSGALLLHGFGQRYDLPISLAIYLFAAGGVVVLSFVMVVLLAGERLGAEAVAYPRRRLAAIDAAAASPAPRVIGGLIGVLGLLTVILTGILGRQQPFLNPAEYLVWVYFWAGAVILSGLVGNVWALLNPFAALHGLVTRVIRTPVPLALPSRLGIWPAIATYFLFACLELTSGIASRPAVLGWIAVVYTLVTLAGTMLFGAREYLTRAEGFTVLFDIVARFAPVEVVEDGPGIRRVYLRPPGAGLLRPEREGWDRVVFIILMLSTLAFDGILATPLFRAYQAIAGPAAAFAGALSLPILKTVALLLLTMLFLSAFVLVMRFVMWLGWPQVGAPFSRWQGVPVRQAMSAFALTLVPIALVYNAAHNYTYVVLQSQGLIPLLADPFGAGWHLVPTAGYRPSFALAGAAVVWYVQVVLIVLGHVIAVYLAHLRAGERFKSASHALLSQYPMLLLMVLYTMTSLWILAQPITRES